MLIRLANMERRASLKTERARALRHAETEAEVRLWERLRDRRLNNYKFVRQFPVATFIADFACRSRRLIVEVDGATHGSEEEIARDRKRTVVLGEMGWVVLRIWNDDVIKRLDEVCDAIVLALEEIPSSALRAPSPASERRR